jgi:hypothetical protein
MALVIGACVVVTGQMNRTQVRKSSTAPSSKPTPPRISASTLPRVLRLATYPVELPDANQKLLVQLTATMVAFNVATSVTKVEEFVKFNKVIPY